MSEVKSKKVKKGAKNNKNKVVPFKRDLRLVSSTANPVDFEQLERDKVNQYGRDLAKDIGEYAKQFRMSPGFFLLFYTFPHQASRYF